MLPRISVITPNYNQADFIEQTILSVLNQNYPNLEFIVVDGASTDGSLEIISKYIDSIDIIISESDNGQAEAINKGLKLATGQIICWLNSDDMFTTNTLTEVGKFFSKTPFDFLYGDGFKFYQDGILKGLNKHIRVGSDVASELSYRDPFQQPSTFWSTAFQQSAGLLNEELDYAFDWEFFIKGLQNFTPIYFPRPLSIYRIHAGHKSGSGGKERALEIMEVVKNFAPPDYIAAFDFALAHYKMIRSLHHYTKRYTYIFVLLTHPTAIFRLRISRVKAAVRMLS